MGGTRSERGRGNTPTLLLYPCRPPGLTAIFISALKGEGNSFKYSDVELGEKNGHTCKRRQSVCLA